MANKPRLRTKNPASSPAVAQSPATTQSIPVVAPQDSVLLLKIAELERKLAASTASVLPQSPIINPSGNGFKVREKVPGLGLVTGFPPALGRYEFMDLVFMNNNRPEWQLSDTQLSILFRVEHPTLLGRMNEFIVRAARREFNLGIHGRQRIGRPPQPTLRWVVAADNRTRVGIAE